MGALRRLLRLPVHKDPGRSNEGLPQACLQNGTISHRSRRKVPCDGKSSRHLLEGTLPWWWAIHKAVQTVGVQWTITTGHPTVAICKPISTETAQVRVCVREELDYSKCRFPGENHLEHVQRQICTRSADKTNAVDCDV